MSPSIDLRMAGKTFESVELTMECGDFNAEYVSRIVKHAMAAGHERVNLRLWLAGLPESQASNPRAILTRPGSTIAPFESPGTIGVPNYMPGDQLCKRRDGPDNSRRTHPHCETVKLQKRIRFRFRVEFQTVEKGRFHAK